MKRKSMGLVLIIAGVLYLAAGCSSDKDANADKQESKQTGDQKQEEPAKSEHAEVFKETDKIAKKFYEAGFELNIPVAYEMLSPKGKKELNPEEEFQNYVTDIVNDNGDKLYASDLIKPKTYQNYKAKYDDQFKDFEKLNDEYEIRRYDYTYDEETKEIIYRVEPWRNFELNEGDSNYIKLKQNKAGEWKVKAFMNGSLPDQVSDKDSGTILHAYREYEESKEDEYGFE